MRTRHSLSIILAVLSLASPLFGQFAYVVNEVSDSISEFKINGTTGLLTGIGTARTGNSPTSITVDPTGSFAYVTNAADNTVSAYSIAANGTLARIGSPIASHPFPSSVAVDPAGHFAYVASYSSIVNGTGSAYSINSNGSLAAIGTFPEQLSSDSVVVDRNGKYVYVANRGSSSVSAFSVNPNGTLTQLQGSPFAVLLQPSSLAINPALKWDCLYVAEFGSNKVSGYFLWDSGGALNRRIPGSPFPTDSEPQSVAVQPAGKFAFVANFGANDVTAYNVNSNCEWTVPRFHSPTGQAPSAVAVDPTGKFVYVANSGSNSVWGYKIQSNGSLQVLPGGHFHAGADPVSIAVR